MIPQPLPPTSQRRSAPRRTSVHNSNSSHCQLPHYHHHCHRLRKPSHSLTQRSPGPASTTSWYPPAASSMSHNIKSCNSCWAQTTAPSTSLSTYNSQHYHAGHEQPITIQQYLSRLYHPATQPWSSGTWTSSILPPHGSNSLPWPIQQHLPAACSNASTPPSPPLQ